MSLVVVSLVSIVILAVVVYFGLPRLLTLMGLHRHYHIPEFDPNEYDVIFMAGGWGAAYDLAQSQELADLITKANAADKLIGSVCHGALGLVSAKGTDGELLVKGRRVTGVTNNQINVFGIAITPKHPEEELIKAGAIYVR